MRWRGSRARRAKVGPKIIQGEQEHLDDFKEAYDISLGKAAGVINDLAGTEFQASSKKKAHKAAVKAVEAHEKFPQGMAGFKDKKRSKSWKNLCKQIAFQTGERDMNEYHSIQWMQDKENKAHLAAWMANMEQIETNIDRKKVLFRRGPTENLSQRIPVE